MFSLVFTSIYTALYIFFVSISPLPYNKMDIDNDGWIELSDVFSAIDVGTRETEIDGVKCLEYYYLKDGLPEYIECNSDKEKH